MSKALKKALPLLVLTLFLAVAFVLFSSLADNKPVFAAFLDPSTWVFIAVIGLADFCTFRRIFS